MSNPSGPYQGNETAEESADKPADDVVTSPDESPSEDSAPTEAAPIVEEHPTEVMAVEDTGAVDSEPATEEQPAERRYTAPSAMDSSATKFIETNPEPATEIISTTNGPLSSDKPVVALILVIAALAAVAILGTLLLTRDSDAKASQEEMVRTTIKNFDVAVQKG